MYHIRPRCYIPRHLKHLLDHPSPQMNIYDPTTRNMIQEHILGIVSHPDNLKPVAVFRHPVVINEKIAPLTHIKRIHQHPAATAGTAAAVYGAKEPDTQLKPVRIDQIQPTRRILGIRETEAVQHSGGQLEDEEACGGQIQPHDVALIGLDEDLAVQRRQHFIKELDRQVTGQRRRELDGRGGPRPNPPAGPQDVDVRGDVPAVLP